MNLPHVYIHHSHLLCLVVFGDFFLAVVYFLCENQCGRGGGPISQIQDHDLSDRVLRNVPSTAVSGEFQAEHIYVSISAKTLQKYFGYSPFKKKRKKKGCTYYVCVMFWEVFLGTLCSFFAQSCCTIGFLNILLSSWDATCDFSA